jgi:hypothetical protein
MCSDSFEGCCDRPVTSAIAALARLDGAGSAKLRPAAGELAGVS